MRLLIYGAGVIGSLYAVLFSKAGYDVTIYARGRRLQELKVFGLVYREKGAVKTAKVRIIDHLEEDDCYDFIITAVRETQIHAVLEELHDNCSPTIVTMVNTMEDYKKWEKIAGEGRILPAFPGAGGSIENGILHASLTPTMIQRTTFGEINGEKTERVIQLSKILEDAKISYEICEDIQTWQLCHLSLVVPLADAYYESDDPQHVGQNKTIMEKTAMQLKENFSRLIAQGYTILPKKLTALEKLPVAMLAQGLSLIYESEFGNTFMYQHAVKASDEMRSLHNQFYAILNKRNNGMIRMENLREEEIKAISEKIADAFYDYQYNPEDEGLIKYIHTREDMFIYIHAIVLASYRSDLLYTTSERQAGYLILSGEGCGTIGFTDGMKMIIAEKKALGGYKNMKKFIQACFSEGNTIETRMRKAKRKFIRIEVLVVNKEYQKQGYMKKMLEYVYALADKKKVPVILDTDDKDKCDRYVHLGMTIDRIRTCSEKFHMYDLIREPE